MDLVELRCSDDNAVRSQPDGWGRAFLDCTLFVWIEQFLAFTNLA